MRESSTMRVLVCGGRDFDDRGTLDAALDRLHQQHGFTLVIAGGARGADTLAEDWARARGVVCQVYRADWEGLGRKAGPIRNQQMLTEGKPELVVAFPGGRGTAHMVRIAREAGVEVIEVTATVEILRRLSPERDLEHARRIAAARDAGKLKFIRKGDDIVVEADEAVIREINKGLVRD
jgi:hypothetical protein